MSDLTPTPGWDAVPQLETVTFALAGPGGVMNAQAQALLNRQEYLRVGTGRVADTITALKAIDKTKHTLAFVFGYYAAGDGGGGEYWLDAGDTTTSDNGGTVIVATDGGRWKLSLRDCVSIKQFGAKGDGVTDSSAACQAAIDWACNNFTPSGNALSVYAPPGSYVAGGLLLKRQGLRFFGSGRFNTSFTAPNGQSFVFASNNQATTTGINELTIERLSIKFINNLVNSSASAGIKLRYGYGHTLRDIHISRSPGTGAHAAFGLDIGDGVYTTNVDNCSLDRERIKSLTSNRATTITHKTCDAEQVEIDNSASIRYIGCTVQGYEAQSAPVGRVKITNSDSVTFRDGYMESDRANDDLFQIVGSTDISITDNDFRGFNQSQLNTYLSINNVDGLVSAGNSFLRGSNANWNYITRGGTNKRLRLLDRDGANNSMDEAEFSGRLIVTQGNPLVDTSTLSSVTTFGTQTRAFNAWSLIGANNSAVVINMGDQDNAEVGGVSYDHTSDTMTFKVNNVTRLQIDSTGKLKMPTATTTTSATAGGATALPATPSGYLSIDIGGVTRKIPYYA